MGVGGLLMTEAAVVDDRDGVCDSKREVEAVFILFSFTSTALSRCQLFTETKYTA